jgi:hypothetical protein
MATNVAEISTGASDKELARGNWRLASRLVKSQLDDFIVEWLIVDSCIDCAIVNPNRQSSNSNRQSQNPPIQSPIAKSHNPIAN